MVMEMLKYTCTPSFIIVHYMVCKLKGSLEKINQSYFLNGHHGNAELHIPTKFNTGVYYSLQV